MKIRFHLNNVAVEIEADADERLADVLRRDFGLRSVRKSCLQGICGSCTVLLNDHPVPSCMLPIFAVSGKNIITLEAFSATPEYKDIMAAFEKEGITLCRFCSAGTVLTAHSIVQKHWNPTDEQIRDAYIGITCRCTDIVSITAALKQVCRSKRSKRHEK